MSDIKFEIQQEACDLDLLDFKMYLIKVLQFEHSKNKSEIGH